MRLSVVLATAFLSGPCSGSSGEQPSSEPAKAASAAAIASAAAPALPALSTATAPAATGATTAAATTTATAPPHAGPGSAPSAAPAPASGPCATLSQKCQACPPGVAQIACASALTAGIVDPTACTNALNNKDMMSQCGGSTPKPPTSGATVTPPAPPPTPPPAGTGPCADLAKKCAKCPAGAVALACQGALAAGAVNPTACTTALNDANIKGQCN